MNDTNERSVASTGSVEPVAWAIQFHGEDSFDGHWTYDDKNTAEICLAGCGSKGVVVPLYRSPTLTDAERKAVETSFDAMQYAADELGLGLSQADCDRMAATLRGLL